MKKILASLIFVVFIFVGCTKAESPDIINLDAEYLYFYGNTCPYCQKLNSEVEKENLFSKIAVEKREVYSNNENRKLFLALTKELNIENVGVPFVYDKITKTYAVGVDDALIMFKNRLNTIQKDTSNTGAITN